MYSSDDPEQAELERGREREVPDRGREREKDRVWSWLPEYQR